MKNEISKQHSIKVGENIIVLRPTKKQSFARSKALGSIELLIEDENGNHSLEIDLGNEWVFLFSEIAELYSNIGKIDLYSHQWKTDGYILRVTHKRNQGVLLMIKKEGQKGEINIILGKASHFSLIGKLIEVVQEIENFRFSIYNPEDPKRNLSFAKIDDKNGTIITTFGGISFSKPHLSESDKYQLKYSAMHRLLYGRWLTVHTERVNISSDGIITTVDEEYILDTNEKNKSTFVALVLLASLSFKE